MEAGKEKWMSHIASVPLSSVIAATFQPQQWELEGVDGAGAHLAPLLVLVAL